MTLNLQIYLSCFNESESIGSNLLELYSVINLKFNEFEVIVVDNASEDSTPEIVGTMTKQYSNLRLARLETNLGYSGSINYAIKDASAELLLIMDGDFQFSPEYTSKMLDKIQEGNEIVFIRRMNLVGERNRRIASKFFVKLLRLMMKFPHEDLNGGMRLMTRDFYSQHPPIPKGRLANVALWWKAHGASIKYDFVDVIPRARKGGESSIPWNKPIRLFFESVVELIKIRKNESGFR